MIYSAVGGGFGLVFYYVFAKIFGKTTIGLIALLICAAIGYGIASLKVPESNSFEVFRKTGGEKIDDIILRYVKFKAKGKRIYIQKTKEEEK